MLKVDEYEFLVREVARSFRSTWSLVAHHLASYEHFMSVQLPEIVEEYSPLEVVCRDSVHVMHLSDVSITKPVVQNADGFIHRLTPSEAFLRKLSYMADVFCNIRHEVYRLKDGETQRYQLQEVKVFVNVHLFQFPAMCGSSVCYDRISPERQRGTFIINGYEKCIITQETLKSNFPYVYAVKKVNGFCCHVRCMHPHKIRSTSTLNITISGTTKNSPPLVFVKIPFLGTCIPLLVVFRYLGVDDATQVCGMIVGQTSSAELCNLVRTVLGNDTSETAGMSQSQLLDWISQLGGDARVDRKKRQTAQHIFNNEFFPHCHGEAEDLDRQRAFYLAFCVRKLVQVYIGELSPDDKDSFVNKRARPTGSLMALLTRALYRGSLKHTRANIYRCVKHGKAINAASVFTLRSVTNGFRFAFRTGNWGVQKGQNQAGTCQVLNLTNLPARLSHLRQLNTPVNRESKSTEPRQLHPSHWGILCAAETPEGRSAGLLSSLAVFARVRVGTPAHLVLRILKEDLGVQGFDKEKDGRATMVLLNGVIIGFTEDPVRLAEEYRRYRSWHCVPIDSSVAFKPRLNHMCIDVEGEDIFRPLFSLQHFHKLPHLFALYKDHPHLLWNQLLIEGVLENINKEEEATLPLIAIRYADLLQTHKSYSHLEIHPSFTLHGVSAGLIPFSNHNQAPRNIYQSAMQKQAVPKKAVDFETRLENKTTFLTHPQRPIVTTWTQDLIEVGCTGQVALVAIQCITGYNQEDSILINKASVERGFMQTAWCKTYRDSETSQSTDKERFEVCPEDKGRKRADYSKLDPATGVAPVGTQLTKDDVIIGKTFEFTNTATGERTKKDMSTVVSKIFGHTRVEKVAFSETKEGRRAVAVRTLQLRTPEVGDKLSSCHGQKGVIGAVVPTEDMPRTKEGIVPDIIINCHAIPSRMTIGQLVETIAGKLACQQGICIDGTPFRGKSAKDIQAMLQKMGLETSGKETMYCGMTGEMLKNKVFLGACYYQRLHHFVQDKVHSRITGPNQLMTRQPVAGRAREGGLRVGEMETNALHSHGASSILLDRLLECSDKYDTVVCSKCHFLAEKAAPQETKDSSFLHKQDFCRFCRSHQNIQKITIPYSLKILAQELAATHIGLKFITKQES